MLLDMIAARGDTQTISDTRAQMGYGELAALAARLQSALPKDQHSCLGLVPENTLEGVSLLLAALDAGLPTALIAPGQNLHQRLPPFCNHLVTSTGAAQPPEIKRLEQAGNTADPERFYVATSGSTGAPKWLVHDTARLIRNAQSAGKRLGHTPQRRILIPVPIHHMFGLGAALIPALLTGASIHLVQRGNPLEVFGAERDFDPNFAYFVPSQVRSILAMRRRPRPYAGLCIAGDKLSPEEAARCENLHGPVLSLYGSSETGVTAANDPSDTADIRHQSAGRLLPGVRLGDDPQDPEQPFPLRLRHPDMCLGIAGSDGAVANKQPDVHETGDIALLLPGGQLRIIGRRDHALKRDGLLVHLSDIEASIAQCAGVADTVVVVSGQSRRGDGLVAFYTPKPRAALICEDLRRHCIDTLPSRAVPDRFIQLDALPRLASGKPDRPALVELARRES
ncbi:AMP-dependent synthetase [Actibacterium atlanticum]|uniref:AMP-dependent synthetase n=1 Tax=Actibacterium atlanticum TaxID=1461693 RepID=A0A058ZLR5_9RHOB|nr:long-chain fatty acid--CoA ligase [Actibacterium atlanticum]KCV82150.1 AMP-dependent synthetase [Actibacterium atlanticum]